MKASYSQKSVNAFLRIIQSNGMSTHRRLATLSQPGTFPASIGLQSNTQDSWFREGETMGGDSCDHRSYGYRTVSPRRGRSYATSTKVSVEYIPTLLSLVHSSVGQHIYQDEYSFIMASHCPVSSEQCEKIRLVKSFMGKESSTQDLKNLGAVKGLVDSPMGDSRMSS